MDPPAFIPRLLPPAQGGSPHTQAVLLLAQWAVLLLAQWAQHRPSVPKDFGGGAYSLQLSAASCCLGPKTSIWVIQGRPAPQGLNRQGWLQQLLLKPSPASAPLPSWLNSGCLPAVLGGHLGQQLQRQCGQARQRRVPGRLHWHHRQQFRPGHLGHHDHQRCIRQLGLWLCALPVGWLGPGRSLQSLLHSIPGHRQLLSIDQDAAEPHSAPLPQGAPMSWPSDRIIWAGHVLPDLPVRQHHASCRSVLSASWRYPSASLSNFE